ncbi:aldo/keto reductase [Phytomonospora endophytica]|uniref:Aryl-alcohol dehydrogenase-like predicted oxidoreductase n=1 Tax=Phytomonospora endophytica TaxID=714109 RepID=A0A841FAQ3_9ACTN|nr:aldo/keto reductase [Phytomonospora endophytica]MBB6034341.1 aryl-alcohol dehydrogenase-like predicted oxidoreductase [Phytomonospora endophytica]GIG66734.1 oxidoreductase [Phytomonospora endophytica]
MTARTLDLAGHRATRMGFGAMRLPTEPGDTRAASIALLRRVVELGVTVVDTAHMYGWGANEELVAEALHPYPEGLLVTTKTGVERRPDLPDGAIYNGSERFLRAQVDEALRRLRAERIDLLQLHRIDPEIPVAEQAGTLRDLRDEGKIGHIGLSEVDVEQLTEARATVEIASVQNRYNVLDREHEAVLDACTAEGIAFLPWRPVAAGNTGAAAPIAEVAAELDATPTQVSLAWLLRHSPVMLPIPGTASPAHLAENVAAADLELSDEQYLRLSGVG